MPISTSLEVRQPVEGDTTAVGTTVFLVDGNTINPPGTATSTGVRGQLAYNAGFLYICVATNTWRRVAIASW